MGGVRQGGGGGDARSGANSLSIGCADTGTSRASSGRMPSRDHELAIELLRRDPRVLVRILRVAFDIEIASELEPAGQAFGDIEPSTYTADLVLVSADATLVIEVQLWRDADKRMSWPFYTASAHAMTRRRTLLLVIALDRSIADWSRRPITTFQDGTFCPIVIGPAEVPRIVDVDIATAHPELAVLSALMHGAEPDALDVGRAGLTAAAAVAQQDEDRGRLDADAVLASMSVEDQRLLLEVVMKPDGYPRSEFGRQNYDKGWAEGLAEGKAEGVRAVLATLCREHGIPWTDARAANVAALDEATLERLIVRVIAERRWPDDA